ncbi:MAG TPA: hypothetical protein PKL68_02640 [Actinomycetota bacterium]|jgi:hypothetical protein|nr:hypothetical protein [Actinomycetota bacterium]HNE89093.1 hypothetical protein [Actinomycetota bacterium]HNL50830.1 hypothetical protein [Actinomycetota bacterium]HNO14818.1 hypothetical protein [Actinomycetota bacterium]HUM85843.1 hypothetical protein [Actinomycetota bacterium]
MLKPMLGAGTAIAIGTGALLGGAAVPAQAKTVKACVKKKSGEVRILTGKKTCKKGWKKVSWNQKGKTGPQGNPGAQGPNLVVKDGTGKVLGKFLGVLPQGITIISVEIDGGSYLYLPSGALYPGFSSSSPSFKNNTCTGPAYVSSSSASSTQFLTGSAGGPTRFVYRPTTPVFGAPFAWQLTTTTEAVVNQPLWQLDSAGACVVDEASFTGTLVTMASVTAPQDVPGPLTIG